MKAKLGLVLNFPRNRIWGIAERGERLLRLWVGLSHGRVDGDGAELLPTSIHCCVATSHPWDHIAKALCWSWAPELVQGRICCNLHGNTGVWVLCSPGCDTLDAARAAKIIFQSRGSTCKPCSCFSCACQRPAHLPAFLPGHWAGWDPSSSLCLLCDGSARTDCWNLHNLNFK